jgi:hypothetical protein
MKKGIAILKDGDGWCENCGARLSFSGGCIICLGGPTLCEDDYDYICHDKENEVNDTELLDWIQSQLDKARYTGKCVFRESSLARGWRLHETSRPEAVSDVRQAIKNAMEIERSSGGQS